MNSHPPSDNLPAKNTLSESEITDEDRLFAALAYISQYFLPVIVPLFILLSEGHKTRPFQRYHAIHALGLMALAITIGVAGLLLGIITLGCALIILAIPSILLLFSFLYYAYLAHQGKYFHIPVVTSLVSSYLPKDVVDNEAPLLEEESTSAEEIS